MKSGPFYPCVFFEPHTTLIMPYRTLALTIYLFAIGTVSTCWLGCKRSKMLITYLPLCITVLLLTKNWLFLFQFIQLSTVIIQLFTQFEKWHFFLTVSFYCDGTYPCSIDNFKLLWAFPHLWQSFWFFFPLLGGNSHFTQFETTVLHW